MSSGTSAGVLPIVAVAGLLLLVSGALGFHAIEQDRRITRLSEKLEALQRPRPRAEHDATSSVAPSDMRALEDGVLSEVVGGALARAALRAKSVEGKSVEAKAAEAKTGTPAPRVAVSADEVARVESALLTLLESNHLELNAKLRSVVEGEQATKDGDNRGGRGRVRSGNPE